jgi:hypothetical protein
MIYPPVTADLTIFAPVQKAEMVKRLKDVAAETQADILAYLGRVRTEEVEDKEPPRVKDIQSFWVANMVICKATKEVVLRLADRPDVALIELEGIATIGAGRVPDPPRTRSEERRVGKECTG